VKSGSEETVKNGNGLENTAKLIREYDTAHPNSAIILLLGAGDVDGLRSQIIDTTK
jgi:UDP-N-acetylmuramate-alanine ligase